MQLTAAMSPDDLQRYITPRDIDDAELRTFLAALGADGDWSVFPPVEFAQVWVWQLVHQPTGQMYTLRAERISASEWRLLSGQRTN